MLLAPPDESASGIDPLAVLTLIVSAAAFFVAVQAYRRDRAAMAIEVRQLWEQLHDDWATTILLARGPDDYYTDAQLDERQRLRDKMQQYGQLDINAQVNTMRGYTRPIRRVARFFAYCASLVLRGRLSLSDAYGVFGPEIGRHRSVVLWLSSGDRSDPALGFNGPYGDEDWESMLDQVPETTFFREARETELLFELIWSRMARRHDTYLHIVFQNAIWLRQCKRHSRTRALLPLVGVSPVAATRNAAFRVQLWLGHHLGVKLIEANDEPQPLLPEGYEAVLRRPLWSRRLLNWRLERLRSSQREAFPSTFSRQPEP